MRATVCNNASRRYKIRGSHSKVMSSLEISIRIKMFQTNCICAIFLVALAAAERPVPVLNATVPEPDKQYKTGGKHAFNSCAKLHGVNLIELITEPIDYVMNSICSVLGQYVSCVIEGLKNPNTHIDNIVRRNINTDAVMPSFQKACAARSVLDANAECMRNQSLLMSTSCQNDFENNFSRLKEGMSPPSLCRSYMFTVNCLADAYTSCSSDASKIYRSTYLNLLTEECRNKKQT